MKLKKTKLLSLIMAAALVFESAGMNVVAANNTINDDVAQTVSIEETYDVTNGDVSGDIVSVETENVGTTDGDVSEGDVSAPVADVTSGDVSEGNVQEPVADVTAGDVSEGDVSMGDVSEGDVAVLFPGLPDGYTLSAEQMEAKSELADHLEEIGGMGVQAATGAYVEGEVLYVTNSEEEAQTIAEAFGGELASYGLGVAVIKLSADRTVAQAVEASADVSLNLPAVWPNHYREELANDPALSDKNEDITQESGYSQASGYQWQHKFVGSPTAWAAGYTGKGVKVAVLDSGVLNGHTEFTGRLKKHLNMTSLSAASGDASGHGTHVSGIVAANVNNGKGGAGIAPEASLYVYGLRNGNGVMTSANIIRGINQAIVDQIDVVNMSIGGMMYNGLEEQAMANAYNAGVAMFVASGNDASNGHAYPASYKNAISIGALDRNGKKSVYSNANNKVDFAFPGTEIYSTCYDGGFTYMSGTSMACPVATGVAAVILSGAADIPELKEKSGAARVDALVSVMSKYAKKAGSGTGKGYTFLPDVWDLTIDEMDQVPEAPTFDLKNKSVINATSYRLKITSGTTKGVTIYYNRWGGTPKFKDGKVTNGYEYDCDYLYLSGAKSRTVKAIAVNHITGKASKVTTATYYFKPDPTSVSIVSANGTYKVSPGGKVTLKAVVNPSYAVSNKVAWSVEGGNTTGVTVKNGKVSVAKTAAEGTYYIVATAVDSKGNPYTRSGSLVQSKYTLTVKASKEVKSVKFANKKATATAGSTLPLLNDVTVTYKDGSTATGAAADLVWTSSNYNIAGVSSGGTVSAFEAGNVTIKATVNDGSNKSASCTVTVTQLAESLSISTTVIALGKGKSGQLYANFDPYTTTNKQVEWSVAPVGTAGGKVTITAKGKISADKAASGTWRVTCKALDGSNKTATMDLMVVDPVQSITVASKKIDLQVGVKAGANNTAPMNAIIKGGNASASVRYFSSNPDVARVNSTTGKITANGSGKATITARAYDGSGKKASVTVNVTVPMSSLEIIPADDNSVSTKEYGTAGIVRVGSSIKLTTVAGSSYGEAANKNVIWSVAESDKDLVSISNKGVLKAKSVGADPTALPVVTVYAEAADGSGACDTYKVYVGAKIKQMRLAQAYDEDGLPYAVYVLEQLEGASGWYYAKATSVKVSGAGGYEIGVSNSDSSFSLCVDKTTAKSSSSTTIYNTDCALVSVKVKALGSNKSVSGKVYVYRVGNGYLNLLPELFKF